MKNSTNKPKTKFLITLGSCFFIYLCWKLAALRVGKEIILPHPETAGQTLLLILGTKEFWLHFGSTLTRGLMGFFLSYAVGLVFGLCSGLDPIFHAFFRPVLVTVRSTPSMSLILLALIWFRSNAVTVFVTFLVVFPIVAQNITDAILQIDPTLTEMAHIYRVRPKRQLKSLYLPAIIPYLAAAATAGLGLTWKVMVAAEVLAAPRWGIGAKMDNARIFLNTAEVFAWTTVIILLGLFFDRVLAYLIRKKILHWQ